MYNTGFMTVGYNMGGVFRHVYDHHANVVKQQTLRELKPATYVFFVRYFQKRCNETFILPIELCRLIAAFLF